MLSIAPQRLNALVETTYAAATGAAGWTDLLSQFRAEFDHAYIALHAHDTLAQRNIGMVGAGYSEPYLQSFRLHYAAINPWSEVASRTQIGVAQPSEALLPTDALYRTEWYNDWIRPQEDIGTGAGITLARDAQRIFRISCNIRLADRERLQPLILDTLNALAPHLRRAFAIYQHGRDQAGGASDLLEVFGAAAFLVAADRRILEANRLGRQWLSRADAALDGRFGRLSFSDWRADGWLGRVLAQFARRQLGAAGRSFVLRGPDGRNPGRFRVLPAPRALASGRGGDYFETGDALALVVVSPQDERLPGAVLSPREAEVLALLAEGLGNDRIAFRLGIKPVTVNLHLMSARRRLGARSREEALAIAVRRNLI